MDDAKGLIGLLTGFVLGGIVGLLVGILLAPQSGEETRDVLREKGIELKSRAEELTDEGRVRFQEAIQEGKSAAVQKKEQLTSMLEAEQEAKQPAAKKSKA
ncbi:MAG: YtxH domain-containing protein [Anaerolineae bacterium]|nr:YtxH domain-containing protein [Anaerolineae bacterium]